MTLALNSRIKIFLVNNFLNKDNLNPVISGLIKNNLTKLFSVLSTGSPFKVPVDYTVDTGLVRAYGSGLDSNNVREGVPATFKVDGSKAGRAPLSVDILGEIS